MEVSAAAQRQIMSSWSNTSMFKGGIWVSAFQWIMQMSNVLHYFWSVWIVKCTMVMFFNSVILELHNVHRFASVFFIHIPKSIIFLELWNEIPIQNGKEHNAVMLTKLCTSNYSFAGLLHHHHLISNHSYPLKKIILCLPIFKTFFL